VLSYVQIRGSIPLLWTQTPGYAWDPPVEINPDRELNKEAMGKHINEQIEKYSKLKLVNLVDKKGAQKRLGDTLNDILRELNNKNVDCVWFDFHEECKKMQWNNLSKLIEIIKLDIEAFGYFSGTIELSIRPKVTITRTQSGIIRTNCLDSLDRTGIVQSVIARVILHSQLHEAGFESSTTKKENVFEPFDNPLMEQIFRNLWTNTGDQLSVQYSGTKALKTDFTRTGKRTTMGVIWDGKNGLQRYYIGRFTDGYQQDALELAAGTIDPAKEEVKERDFISPAIIGLATVSIDCKV
jgi:hypothetical protein